MWRDWKCWPNWSIPQNLYFRSNMETNITTPVKILLECQEIMSKKSRDYQNPNSRIRQADYYPNGVKTILDIIQAKILRLYSVVEAMENDPNYKPNFESLEDSFKDAINYAAFGASYLKHGIDGQTPERDFLNRKVAA